MRKKSISKIFVLTSALLIFASNIFAVNQEINREVSGIKLGMSIQAVSEIFQMVEKEDPSIGLMRKYGFGNPDEQEKINKLLGVQRFDLKGNFPKGAESMEASFLKGILYRVALHYGKNYIQKVDWDIFTLPAFKKYGQPLVRNDVESIDSFSYQWSDGQTGLEIAKGGIISKDKNKFTVSIYNVFYTDINLYNILQKDEEAEEEKVKNAPIF